MWEKLKRSDRSRDELFIANVRANFHKTHFTPEKQTIRQFVESLKSFRMQVANTGKPITDDKIRDRLLSALLLDSGLWQQNRIWAIQQKADLEATISLSKTKLLRHREMPTDPHQLYRTQTTKRK